MEPQWTIDGTASETEPKVGETYRVDKQGTTFYGKCVELNRGAAWFEKLAGGAHALLPDAQRQAGDRVLVRAAECRLFVEQLPKQQ